MSTNYIDLAQGMPDELINSLGEAMILFGRLEYMVLLVIKRVRDISLEEAKKEYKAATLGSRLNGIAPCAGAEDKCRNRKQLPGLRQLADGNVELSTVCDEIESLTTTRNTLVHGLITTIADHSRVFHKSKQYELTEYEICEMNERIILAIEKLNELVPIPGLTTTLVTGPDLDISYGEDAIDSAEPIVHFEKTKRL